MALWLQLLRLGCRFGVAHLPAACPQVEVSEEEPATKAQRRKEKRQKVKGNLTPLTGKNYRQLLERLQARQGRLEELREQDAGKAQELEAKMKWTNLLYKAEGVKIRDKDRKSVV